MKKGFKITVFAVLVCLLAGVFAPAAVAVSDECGMDIHVTYKQTEAREMLALVNELRQPENAWYWNETDTEKVWEQNLQPLAYDYGLEQIAMQRAAEIAVSFSHTRPDGTSCFTAFNYNWYTIGENIAAGYLTGESVFVGWSEADDPYAGQGHRRNMLNPNFTAVGIGHVYYNGRHYWTQEFGAPSTGVAYTAPPESDETVWISLSATGHKDENKDNRCDLCGVQLAAVPAAPANVHAKATADKTITVYWNAVEGATQYNIYRYNGAQKAYVYKGTTFATAAQPTQYVDKNLNAGTTYYYRVVAVDKSGDTVLQSEKSAAASAKAIGTPAAPQNVSVKATAEKTLTVFWNAVEGATQYNIYRYNGTKKEYVYKGTTFATAAQPTQYVDKNLNAGTTYYYKVVAVTKADGLTLQSAKSASASAKVIGVPAVPQNVTVKATADKTLTVFWNAVEGATQYNIYRYNGTKKEYVYKGTTFATAAQPTQYADKNLNAGVTYYYKVVAVTKTADLTLVSAKSASASAKVIGAPAVPQNVAARASGRQTVTVSWSAVEGATQYNIYRYNGAQKAYVYKGTTFVTAVQPTQYVDKNLSPGTTYYYRVVAVTKADGLTLQSAKSAAASAIAK